MKTHAPQNTNTGPGKASTGSVIVKRRAKRIGPSLNTMVNVLGRQALDQDDRGETISIEDLAKEFGVELD